ncbi:NAD(P)/FAD-dependent oxidoreductase [Nitrosovibrio sp. Nv17]|uniref:flavin-containing monooxygenase n=1 Tax=Nitrosovibrio sp. Nv17 TaxID=1855339 RepID=UPI000908CE57|nr:NAD(P)-binding domain-containing protein [Nitrosovibrio sp. Nv17]SFW32671.1 Predicted flavoprotein CzcO associated with the cation diffusion facilitator CzcD [Nitrosovibrio sp. Nv17]
MHDTRIDRTERHCIIGAGPSGLAQARALGALGLPFDVFERHRDVGGLWDIDNPGTPVYEHAHFVSSRTQSGFTDFPFPPGADYPRRDEVHAYLRAFADAYDLRRHIHFSSEVTRVEPAEGMWAVTAQGRTRIYRSVICASGMHWSPNLPEIPGRFIGWQRHAIGYRSPEEFRGQRVLVVGAGNSGCDIATEAARNARAAYHSLRRGYHFLPKHMFGKPADVYERENEWIPLRIRQWVLARMLAAMQGDLTRYGLQRPRHRILESQPIMNSDILSCIAHGDLIPKPDVLRFDGSTVHFADGSTIEVDQVVFATGYRAALPYLDAGHVEWAGHGLGHFLTCFSRLHPNLFTPGFYEGNAAVFPHLELFASLVARYLQAQAHGTGRDALLRSIAQRERGDLRGSLRLIDTPRHAAYCDWLTFRKRVRALHRELGWPMPAAADFAALRAAPAREEEKGALPAPLRDEILHGT